MSLWQNSGRAGTEVLTPTSDVKANGRGGPHDNIYYIGKLNYL